MYSTTYHRASSVADAVKLLKKAEDGKFVSGGMTLIPAMKTRLAAPSDLVDLRHVAELKGIKISGRTVTIGAGTTHAEVVAHEKLAALCPAICRLAAHIGDPHVRHMGTIGGSVANNDPAADYPAACLALGATIVTQHREIAADDFFLGLFETALEEGEIITAVRFPFCEASAYEKFRNPASRFALAGVFVARRDDAVRVGVTGAGSDGVFRWEEGERALAQNHSLERIAPPAADAMLSDIHARGDYRAHLVKVLAQRAYDACDAG